jgi:hypothetical protein
MTVSAVVRLVPLLVAVMVADAEVDTAVVETVNVPLVLPPATVTEEGTVATDVLLLDKDTVIPPVGAALSSVTVP